MILNWLNMLAESFDLPILDWIAANLQSSVMDKIWPIITLFGEGGIFWIACAVLMLCFRKTRKAGFSMAVALLLGVPASIIGVTMVAIGTSLPELVTTLTAIVKKEASMSVGNIIGANVIDLTLILPVCSAVSGGKLTIGAQTTALDLPACLTLCCIAVIPPLLKGKFYRWQGVLMLALYAGYVVMLVA